MSKTAGPVLLFTWLLFVAGAHAQTQTEIESDVPASNRRSLADCVQLAFSRSPSIEGVAAATAVATAERRSARGRFGPLIRVDGNVMQWDSPFALPLNLMLPEPLPPVNVPPLPIRDATTAEISATAIQPLTGLWTVYEGHRALQLGEDAARHQQRTTQNDVALAVSEAYLQALEGERMVELVGVQIQTIEVHVERARRLLESDLIGRNDVLEAEVRLAEARAQLIEARGGARLARANLAFQIGLPSDQEVWPADLPLSASAGASPDADPADRDALGRPELATARARVEQAHAGVNVAMSQMLPQINAVFGLRHIEGVYFQPENAWFVGAQLSWNVWEWGSTYYAIDAAQARTRQAEAAEAQAREGLRLEARQTEIAFDTASAYFDVARTTVTLAEQNFEIVERRFAQQVGTSTDVLDAQAMLHAVRARMTSAESALLLAQIRRRRARGQDPVAIEGGAP